jgi:hypothetical protein
MRRNTVLSVLTPLLVIALLVVLMLVLTNWTP